MENNFISEQKQSEDFNLRAILEKYLIHWPWFVLGVFLCVSFTFVYLRYATPQYQAITKILVKDESKGGMLSELSVFSDMGLGNAVKNNIDNEIEILKSRTLVESTVKMLKLNVSLIKNGNVISSEVYKDIPIVVDFINLKPDFYSSKLLLKFVSLTPNTFTLESNSDNEEASVITNNKNEFRYGEAISTPIGDLIITKQVGQLNQNHSGYQSIGIQVSPLDDVVESYFNRLNVNPVSKTSSIVEVTMTDPIIKRSEAFLNRLIQIYNDDAAADKNFISENTSKFISSRLMLITEELDGVEQDVESFKQSNNLNDIESEAKLFNEGSREYNKKSVETEIQLNVVTSMLDFMKKSKNTDLLPTNLIAAEGGASELINSYNHFVLERNRILKSATVDNPSVVKLDGQLSSLKSNVVESLSRLQSSLRIQIRNLKNQEELLDSKIEKIPVQERQFRVIARQQKVKEELYLYLLQKREETAISLSATAPNARVIDVAKASTIPVSPKKKITYLAALLLGLFITFGIIYIKNLLVVKVKKRFEVTNKLKIPFLGDIPKSLTPEVIVDSASRSSSAEAMRIVRANLDFMLNRVGESKLNTIFLTSTILGEGKTFVSVNLAGIIACSNKKVLLVGLDFRSPKLDQYHESDNSKGLADYLSSENAIIEDYIFKSKEVEHLDVLLAGNIPPNPTEILMNKKLDDLFVKFKKEYDYIIVDTAPVSLVSDTLIVAKHADVFVYVIRANYLDKELLSIPEMMHNENKLPNMSFILNDTKVRKGHGYGYGNYGKGVSNKKKPWYKFF